VAARPAKLAAGPDLLPYATLALAYVLDQVVGRLPTPRRRLVHVAVVLRVVGASAYTLHVRYTRSSGYVARKVREFAPYL
jgi:hypothetical protein